MTSETEKAIEMGQEGAKMWCFTMRTTEGIMALHKYIYEHRNEIKQAVVGTPVEHKFTKAFIRFNDKERNKWGKKNQLGEITKQMDIQCVGRKSAEKLHYECVTADDIANYCCELIQREYAPLNICLGYEDTHVTEKNEFEELRKEDKILEVVAYVPEEILSDS